MGHLRRPASGGLSHSTAKSSRNLKSSHKSSHKSPHLPRISSNTTPLQEAQQVLAAASAAPDHIDYTAWNHTGWIIPQIYVDDLDEVGSRPLVLMSSALTIILARQMIDGLAPEGRSYKESLLELGELCGICEILPSSHLMSSGLTLVTDGISKRPFASGYLSDVWKARNDNGRVFAIKHFRALEFGNLNHVKKVLRVCHSAYRYFSPEPRH